jgi:hypothetical protein
MDKVLNVLIILLFLFGAGACIAMAFPEETQKVGEYSLCTMEHRPLKYMGWEWDEDAMVARIYCGYKVGGT